MLASLLPTSNQQVGRPAIHKMSERPVSNNVGLKG